MSCDEIVLKSVKVCKDRLHEVIGCIIHTIFFQRSIFSTTHKYVNLDDIEYVKVDNPFIDVQVQKATEDITSIMNTRVQESPGKSPQRISDITMILIFYKNEKKSKFLGLSSSTIKNPWEKWVIQLKVVKKFSEVYNELPNHLLDICRLLNKPLYSMVLAQSFEKDCLLDIKIDKVIKLDTTSYSYIIGDLIKSIPSINLS